MFGTAFGCASEIVTSPRKPSALVVPSDRVKAASAVSGLIVAPIGKMQAEHSGTVTGGANTPLEPASSRMVASFVALFTTNARPRRGRTATPKGLAPVRNEVGDCGVIS